MALLIGSFVNRIDKKGRVSVPKPFRDQFRNQEVPGLYVYPLFKNPAIEACDEEFMRRLSESIEDLDVFSDEQDNLASIILPRAHSLPFDPEGRVVLPKELLDHAKIEDQVVFVGLGARLQIWSPEIYTTYSAEAFKRAQEERPTLKLRPRTPSGPGGAA